MARKDGVDVELRAMVDMVCNRYPKVFSHPALKGSGMAPLGLDIDRELHDAMPDADPSLIDRFLTFYRTRFWYYRCLTSAGAARVGLDGSPCGRVTVAEADVAQAHHDRLLKIWMRRPPDDTCDRTGKTVYASGAAALAAASLVRRSLGDRQETSVYRCGHCGRFHWGHHMDQRPAAQRAVLTAGTAYKHSKRHIEALIMGD